MKQLLSWWLFFSIAVVGATATRADEPATPPDAEARRATAVAKRLAGDHFLRSRQMDGAELRCEIRLDSTEAVPGWHGHWRVHGFATLRYYRADAAMAERERQIREDRSLSAREIRWKIEAERFIRSEVVDFEAVVSKLDAEPAIDVTVR